MIDILPRAADHPIVAGLRDFELFTEQYWVLFDDYIDVLATNTQRVRPGTRGTGRSPRQPSGREPGARSRLRGHAGSQPGRAGRREVRTVIERGLIWAARGTRRAAEEPHEPLDPRPAGHRRRRHRSLFRDRPGPRPVSWSRRVRGWPCWVVARSGWTSSWPNWVPTGWPWWPVTWPTPRSTPGWSRWRGPGSAGWTAWWPTPASARTAGP